MVQVADFPFCLHYHLLHTRCNAVSIETSQFPNFQLLPVHRYAQSFLLSMPGLCAAIRSSVPPYVYKQMALRRLFENVRYKRRTFATRALA